MVSEKLNLRSASPDDVDALAAVTCAAMPMDPQWDYRFPLRKNFPEDHVRCTREMFRSIMEEHGVVVKVVTFQRPGDGDGDGDGSGVPRALAVWEVIYNPEQDYSTPDDCERRRDANFEHVKAFDEALFKAKRSFFDDEYGTHQLHLRILATHPDYQRRGAGSMLCRWGMQLAGVQKMPVTLFSSPLGQLLYTSLGFASIGRVAVHVKGESERLDIGVMIFHAPGGYGVPVMTQGMPAEFGIS